MLKLILSLLIAANFTSSVARAQNEESEEARLAAEKAKRRHYPGGRDEQELTVQAVLPTTSRYPQDPKAAPTAAEKEQSAEPTND